MVGSADIVTPDHIAKMPYLRDTLKETLRSACIWCMEKWKSTCTHCLERTLHIHLSRSSVAYEPFSLTSQTPPPPPCCWDPPSWPCFMAKQLVTLSASGVTTRTLPMPNPCVCLPVTFLAREGQDMEAHCGPHPTPAWIASSETRKLTVGPTPPQRGLLVLRLGISLWAPPHPSVDC